MHKFERELKLNGDELIRRFQLSSIVNRLSYREDVAGFLQDPRNARQITVYENVLLHTGMGVGRRRVQALHILDTRKQQEFVQGDSIKHSLILTERGLEFISYHELDEMRRSMVETKARMESVRTQESAFTEELKIDPLHLEDILVEKLDFYARIF